MLISGPNVGLVTDSHIYFLDGIFSQWRYCDVYDPESGHTFANSEQYMMYYKARMMYNDEYIDKILKETHPARVKKLGREIPDFDNDRWDEIKEAVVYNGNLLKFTQNTDYQGVLLQTVGRQLVKCASYDRIWGIGLDISNPDIFDESRWLGLNLQGKVLSRLAKDMEAGTHGLLAISL